MSLAIELYAADWWALFVHFLSLSLLAVGGAISTAPDIHRYLVDEQQWLSDTQFPSAIALAQSAPGPNVMFVALMGWYVGLNAAATAPDLGSRWLLALSGVGVCMLGILLPSATLTFFTTQWAHRNRELRWVKAFKAGMAPIVTALLIATGWLLCLSHPEGARDEALWALSALTTLVVWRTRVHLLWLLALGAALGALGWV